MLLPLRSRLRVLPAAALAADRSPAQMREAAPLSRSAANQTRSASMKTTRRRYWVFFLLFLFNLIAYVDRVNMSVAGKPIAQEFGLSPVALGYLFSSFLWA